MSRSLEAERSILSALIVDPDANISVVDHLSHEHFSINSHIAIWECLRQAFDAKQYHDVISLADSLEARSELQMIGGMEYLTDLADNHGSLNPLHVRNYWKILDDHKARRRVIASAESMLRAVREINDIDELMDHCQQQLNTISQDVNTDTVTMDKALDKMLERIQHLSELKEGQLVGMTTGIKALDDITMGRQAGLHIIAARPAMGKTVLAMQAVDRAAEQGFASLIISLEMPVDQLVTRSVSAMASLNMQRLKDPRTMTDEDNMKLSTGVHRLKDLPIEYLDKMDTKVAKICQTIRAWHRRNENHGCVVVDYLQLMATDSGFSKNDAVGEITRRFKMLSNELKLPIILVSQLNRSLESRTDKRPINSDLRDSGSIEQDADTITFIYRDEVYNENTQEKGIAELIMGKQRNGPIGTVYVGTELQYQRFIDIGNYTPPEPEPKMGKVYGKGKL